MLIIYDEDATNFTEEHRTKYELFLEHNKNEDT